MFSNICNAIVDRVLSYLLTSFEVGQISLSSFLNKETGLQRFTCLVAGKIAYRYLRPTPRSSGSKPWTFSSSQLCNTPT